MPRIDLQPGRETVPVGIAAGELLLPPKRFVQKRLIPVRWPGHGVLVSLNFMTRSMTTPISFTSVQKRATEILHRHGHVFFDPALRDFHDRSDLGMAVPLELVQLERPARALWQRPQRRGEQGSLLAVEHLLFGVAAGIGRLPAVE